MSERKVLNKYYPPDFDPSKIPRMKLARNRQYTVRLMAPFNMRCKTCGEYIYKGKKFNARKEDVEGDDYLGIRIYRFYIKCTRCLQEISFKTDPKNTDYEIEAGATRNFMALKLAEEQAQREEDEKKEEEATNPMKLLEKRTQQSKQELELLESLEELKDLNRRQQTIDYDQMLQQYDTEAARQRTLKEQEELDEEYVKTIFKRKRLTGTVVEEEIIVLPENDDTMPLKKISRTESSTGNPSSSSESIQSETISAPSTASTSWSSSASSFSSKPSTSTLVMKKPNLGVKIVPKAPSEKSLQATAVSDEFTNVKDISNDQLISQDTKQAEKSIPNQTSIQKNGLSLLGDYSDSSDDEND